MINVYFMAKGKGECVGGIALREKHPTMKVNIWEVYKVYPISEKTVLFQRNEHEFCTVNGKYEHEMGSIEIKKVTGIQGDEWINIIVKEKK
jgi:hypothetical protein